MKLKCSSMLLSLVIMIGLSLPVRACFYDGQFDNPFSESFPGSLDIAIATHNALESNDLHKLESLDGKSGLRRATWWLQLLAEEYAVELESVSYIYLVDSHLWSKFDSESQLKVHTAPKPDEKFSVLLLSEAALYALVNNRIGFNRAYQLGIIHL